MVAALPYLIAIGGAAIKAKANSEQAGEQRAELNQALARTTATQKKANQMVVDEATKLSPVARAAALTTQADQNLATEKSDLQAAGATDSGGNAIIDTAGDNGAVSTDFLKAKADKAISEGNRLSAIAAQLSKTRAPGQLQEAEGGDRAALAEALGSLWSTTGALNNANQETATGIQLPPYAVLGDVAQAGASLYGSKKGAGVGKTKGGVGSIWAGGDDGNSSSNYA